MKAMGIRYRVNTDPPPNASAHPYGICYQWNKINALINDNLPVGADRSKYRIIISCTSFHLEPGDAGGSAKEIRAQRVNRHVLALYIARRDADGDHRLMDDTDHPGYYAMKAADYGGACPPNIPSRV
jgi:hypothetical protein